MIADQPPAPVVVAADRRFSPRHVTALVGERVTWRNADHTVHTVTARDEGLDSGRIPPGGEFSRRFDAPARLRYVCTVHRGMTGTLEVASLALAGPREPVPVGRRASLSGRAPAGAGPVTLVRDGTAVARTDPDAEGRFTFAVTADRPAAYRAWSGPLSSSSVRVAVAPEIRLAARRTGRSISVRIHVPGQAGAIVLLERHERERFGYVRLRRARLDRHDRARLVLRTARRLRLRVRVARPVRGYARAHGGVVVVPRRGAAGRPAPHRHH